MSYTPGPGSRLPVPRGSRRRSRRQQQVKRRRGFVVFLAVALLAVAGLAFARSGGFGNDLAGSSPEEVVANSVRVALKAARQWRVTVLLKGATAHVATPDGQVWSHPAGRAMGSTANGVANAATWNARWPRGPSRRMPAWAMA